MNRLVVIVIVFYTVFVGRIGCFAQERDTLFNKISDDRFIENRLSTSGYENLLDSRVEKFDYNLNVGQSHNRFMFNDFSVKKKNNFKLNLNNGIGPVMKWKGGMATIDRVSDDYPGMMGAERAAVNMYQNVGRFMFGVHADAMKYGYFRGASNQFGVGGAVGVRLSDKVSLIVFGSVYSQVRGRGINPAMMGFMPASGYGGMVDWQIGSFGIMAGMRHEFVPLRGRWEMRPIFAPYWGSGSRRFSIDVGSIIGGLLLDALESQISDINKPGNSSRSLPSVGSPGFIPPHRR